MYKYIFDENNSWWYTIVCKCLWSIPENWVDNEYVLVNAENINEAVSKFDERFSIDSDYESCYEWWSCSCCGRRFSIFTNDTKAESDYKWKYTELYYREDTSYYEKDVYVID